MTFSKQYKLIMKDNTEVEIGTDMTMLDIANETRSKSKVAFRDRYDENDVAVKSAELYAIERIWPSV